MSELDGNCSLFLFDDISFYNTLGCVVGFYCGKKIYDGYVLCKDFSFKNNGGKIVNTPSFLEDNYVDVRKTFFEKFGSEIINFADVIESRFSSSDLRRFYDNLRSINFCCDGVDGLKVKLKPDCGGAYFVGKNKILVNNYSSIYHELFHMASTIVVNGVGYSGFSQRSTNFSLGNGLNEGYTQLLTKRYFSSCCESAKGYTYEVLVASKLEMIVGREIMESLYLNADLMGLVNLLLRYCTYDEVVNFISSVDFLNKYLASKKFVLIKDTMINKCLRDVSLFLIRAYVVMLNERYRNGLIDFGEYLDLVAKYVVSLCIVMKVNKREYFVMNFDDALVELKKMSSYFDKIGDSKKKIK